MLHALSMQHFGVDQQFQKGVYPKTWHGKWCHQQFQQEFRGQGLNPIKKCITYKNCTVQKLSIIIINNL